MSHVQDQTGLTSSFRRWGIPGCGVSRGHSRMRRRRIIKHHSSSVRGSCGHVTRLKRAAWQHAAVHGEGNRYIEHGGELERERRFRREFAGRDNIECRALYRAPGLAEPRNGHNTGHEPGE